MSLNLNFFEKDYWENVSVFIIIGIILVIVGILVLWYKFNKNKKERAAFDKLTPVQRSVLTQKQSAFNGAKLALALARGGE